MYLEQLFGVWKLLNATLAPGSPGGDYGPNPTGRIIFTPDGYVNAMITDLNLVNAALPNGTTWSNATDAEQAYIARLMVTYEGFFTIKTVGNDTTVHTNVELSLTPNYVGTEQVRDATLVEEGGKKILTLVPVVNGTKSDNKLVWEKIVPPPSTWH